jgi:hypothetical protein
MTYRTLPVFPVLLTTAILLAGCREPKVRMDDPESATVSQDWSETDIRTAANVLGDSLVRHPLIANAQKPVVILPLDIKNKTAMRLNTSIIVSQIETALMSSGKASCVAGEVRDQMAREYAYMASGNVAPETQKAPGRQVGCDYLLSGTIEQVQSRSAEGKYRIDYYYIKLHLVDITTGLKVWQGQQETKKRILRK